MTKKKTPQPRPYITKVKSNVKAPSEEPWEIELSQRTLIVGANASRKSAILQSIELALTGCVDDLIGRSTVKDAGMLLTMAPGDSISCNVEFDTGDQRSFAVKKGSRAKYTAGAEDSLPLRDVREALAGSPATLRKSLLKWAAPSATLNDVLGQIPEQFHAKYRDLHEHIGKGKTPTEGLLAVYEYVDKKVRATAKELRGAQKIVEGLEQSIVDVPSEDEVQDAKDEVARLGAVPAVERDVDDIHEAIQKAEAATAQWSQHLQTLGHTEPAEFELAAETVLQRVIDAGMEQCPVCSSHVGAAHLNSCHQHYTNALAKVEEQRNQYEAAQQSLQTWVAELASLRDYRDMLETIEVYHTASARLDSLQSARGQWVALSSARRQCEALEQDVDGYKSLKTACDNAVAKLLGQHAGRFCVRVNAYMPKGWRFHLDMSMKTPRVGLGVEDFRAALSGAEWATVTAALAAVVSEGLPMNQPVVLIPEDRAFDQRTLANVMRGYARFNGQIVMASTTRPRGRPSNAWTIIDLTKTPLCPEDAIDEEV